MKLTRQQLIDAGWNSPDHLETIYQFAQSLIKDHGINTMKYLTKHLMREFPEHHATLRMRDTPAPLTLAIEAETKDEIKNLNIAKKHITELLRCPVVSSGTLMPDACPAASAGTRPALPVGGAISVENAIIPAAHSADICCSLLATFYHTDLPISRQMDTLMQHTRFGPGGREKTQQIHHPVLDEPVWSNPFLKGLQTKAASHIADQGDGNHFAFIGTMVVNNALITALTENGYGELAELLRGREKWHVIVTHHGSRSIGSTVYKRGIDAAIKHTKIHAQGIPDEAAWLSMDTKEGEHYWHALQYIARWTKANHQTIHQKFIQALDSKPIAEIGNEHNFVWKQGSQYLHGKGATPAWLSENGNPLLGLIPLNMAEPILLTIGSNNADHLSFSPHGAGRNKSRRATLRRYTRSKKSGFDQKLLEHDLSAATAGLDVRWFQGRPDITETPLGYKPAAKVRQQINTFKLATIIAEIYPLGSIMSGRPETYEKPLSPKQLRQLQHRKERRKIRSTDWLNELDD